MGELIAFVRTRDEINQNRLRTRWEIELSNRQKPVKVNAIDVENRQYTKEMRALLLMPHV